MLPKSHILAILCPQMPIFSCVHATIRNTVSQLVGLSRSAKTHQNCPKLPLPTHMRLMLSSTVYTALFIILPGASWAAIWTYWLLPKSHILAILSPQAVKTLEPSGDQQTSRTGPPAVCCALGIVVPFEGSICQHRTLWSQLPATRNVCRIEGKNIHD